MVFSWLKLIQPPVLQKCFSELQNLHEAQIELLKESHREEIENIKSQHAEDIKKLLVSNVYQFPLFDSVVNYIHIVHLFLSMIVITSGLIGKFVTHHSQGVHAWELTTSMCCWETPKNLPTKSNATLSEMFWLFSNYGCDYWYTMFCSLHPRFCEHFLKFKEDFNFWKIFYYLNNISLNFLVWSHRIW